MHQLYLQFASGICACLMAGWMFILLIAVLHSGGGVALDFWSRSFWSRKNGMGWLTFYLVICSIYAIGEFWMNGTPYVPAQVLGLGDSILGRFISGILMLASVFLPLCITWRSKKIQDFFLGFARNLVGEEHSV